LRGLVEQENAPLRKVLNQRLVLTLRSAQLLFLYLLLGNVGINGVDFRVALSLLLAPRHLELKVKKAVRSNALNLLLDWTVPDGSLVDFKSFFMMLFGHQKGVKFLSLNLVLCMAECFFERWVRVRNRRRLVG
jgi:hypothetical protein